MRILRILLLVLLLAGAVYAVQTYRQGGMVALQTLPNQMMNSGIAQNALQIDSDQIRNLTKDPGPELQTLVLRSKEVGEHTSKVLGDSVEVNEKTPPIHERALEYGRYLYCQQVVEDYEAQQ